MSSKTSIFFRGGLLLCLLAGANSLRAQLYIDAAGPRNLLVSGKGKNAPELNGKATAKVDSEKKSVSLGYFSSRDFNKATKVAIGTFGLVGQVSSPNGWDELFKSPLAEVSVLGNYTWAKSGDVDGPWFVNASAGFRHDNLRLRVTASDPVKEVGTDTGKASMAIGRQFNHGRSGFALSARFERTSNYEELTKVEVDKRPAREGTLVRSDATPIALMFTHEINSNSLTDLIRNWRNDKAGYAVVAAAYGEYDPSVKGEVNHKIGLNLTLKRFLIPEDKELAERRKVAKEQDWPEDTLDGIGAKVLADFSYPYSFFVEWKQPFGSKRGEVVTGVAMLFTWP